MTSIRQHRPDFVLHIGTMKSGTSYLQAVMRRNKSLLGEDGVFVPPDLVPAVADILGRRGVTKERSLTGAWQEFLDLAFAWQGPRVVASQEFLSGASPEEATRVVATLPKGRVKVVITNRDLARVIPSHWQTVVKNGATWPFADYVQLVLGDAPPITQRTKEEKRTDTRTPARYHRGFWRHHDLAAAIAHWAEAVGIENITLVTVPQSGAPVDELWKRFCTAIDLEPSRYDAEPDAKSNVSLSFAETEMLRAVNQQVRQPLGPLGHRMLVNKYLANKLLRRPPEPGVELERPRLGARSHEQVRQRAAEMVDAVADTGVRVVGDLNDLRVPRYTGDPSAIDTPAPRDAIPDSVPEAISRLILRINKLEKELEEARGADERDEELYQRRFQQGKGKKNRGQQGGAKRGKGKRGGKGKRAHDDAELLLDDDDLDLDEATGGRIDD